MSVLRSALIRSGTRSAVSLTIEDYINLVNEFQFDGLSYGGGVQQTLTGSAERIGSDFVGLARAAYQANGVVFACMMVRQLIFSATRFRWQKLRDGKPSYMFGTPELGLLEVPWAGGTTQDLLNRVIQDADLAGNSYTTTDTPLVRLGGDGGTEIVRLRPDWVEIVGQERHINGGVVGVRRFGYLYTEGGPGNGGDAVPFLANEVAHFAPYPDPLASFRGMSWLTPVIREIQGDGLMNRHKRKFFENGATPNMIIKHDAAAEVDKVKKFAAMMADEHGGVEKAYKTLHLYPGADATVVGRDFQQVDFKSVQGAGETRIAAAAGVHPVIVGLSEGLQGSSLNAGNFQSARRRTADGTMHPLWQNAAGSLSLLLPSQGRDTRLWYDSSGVPFLREDEKDAAEIAETQARTIRTLVDGGYTPESAVAAIEADGDWNLLEHTGLFSVQLQKPGADDTPPPSMGDDDADA